MNSWSRRRKRIILSILIFIVVVLIGVPMFFLFYRAPTCFDARQNGDEAGVDCGGGCQLLCSAESLPLLVKGDARVLTLATSTYQVVALVGNANASAEIYRAGYTLRLYSASSTISVKVVEGFSYVPKGSDFVIFEGPFVLEAGVVPVRATLEWKEETLVWNKNSADALALVAAGPAFSRLETSPRLGAVIKNVSLESASNIDLSALVYDADGNIFAASKSFIDLLQPGAESRAIFTWPKAFDREPARTEIIIRVFPDRSFVR